jgi:threonine dehydratase
MVERRDVVDAVARVGGRVRRTPVTLVDDPHRPGPTWFKCEFMQHTGSFKARGALNRVLAAQDAGDLDAAVGVVAASGGNAGLAVAYAAAQVGVPAQVYVPVDAPAMKVAKLRALGADVVLHGSEYAEAYHAAVERAAQTGALYCHAYDQPDMVAGAGTLALELLDQVPGGFDTVVLACGGGGLMAGVTAGLDGRARVVAVEPENAPTLRDALDAGGPVDVPVSGVAADSLGARRLGEIAYLVAAAAGVRALTVTDEAIVDARRRLWHERRIVTEHGAAAAYAALTSGAYPPAEGERVVVVLCGANTDPTDLAAVDAGAAGIIR